LVYLAHRHGIQGGSFNSTLLPQDLWVTKPEKIDDIETGLKWDWRVGGLAGRTNVALFHAWITDLIQYFNSDNLQVPTYTANVGLATVHGGEVDVTVFPTENL